MANKRTFYLFRKEIQQTVNLETVNTPKPVVNKSLPTNSQLSLRPNVLRRYHSILSHYSPDTIKLPIKYRKKKN